jgi:hypothetical protein
MLDQTRKKGKTTADERETKRSINNSNTVEEFPAQKCVARRKNFSSSFFFSLLFRIVEDKGQSRESLARKKEVDGWSGACIVFQPNPSPPPLPTLLSQEFHAQNLLDSVETRATR